MLRVTSSPLRGESGPCLPWTWEQAAHTEAVTNENVYCSVGEFPPHQQWEHHMLSIIFFTPDTTQASDVKRKQLYPEREFRDSLPRYSPCFYSKAVKGSARVVSTGHVNVS